MNITPYDANPAQWARDITRAVRQLLAAQEEPEVAVPPAKPKRAKKEEQA